MNAMQWNKKTIDFNAMKQNAIKCKAKQLYQIDHNAKLLNAVHHKAKQLKAIDCKTRQLSQLAAI